MVRALGLPELFPECPFRAPGTVFPRRLGSQVTQTRAEGLIIRGAMRFRVTCMLKCYNCGNEESKQDDQIEAKDQADALTVFEENYRLCETCLGYGTNARVKATPISIEEITG